MKISEFIKMLEEMKDKYGDVKLESNHTWDYYNDCPIEVTRIYLKYYKDSNVVCIMEDWIYPDDY